MINLTKRRQISAEWIDSTVHPYISERIRCVSNKRTLRESGKFVLYYINNTLRAYENPALDFAKVLATELDLPLLVHAFLDDRDPFMTSRRAQFLLEGYCELQGQYENADIPFTFRIITNGKRQPHYLTLAHRAACVVTDEPFVEPYISHMNRLRTSGAPTFCVDNANIYPAKLTTINKCKRAYIFREHTQEQRRIRMIKYPVTKYSKIPSHLGLRSMLSSQILADLPFTSYDLQNCKIEDVVKNLHSADKSVPAVRHTVGGTSAARARWSQFLRNKLKLYHKKRNDPLSDNVSRMSAYLNLGMISPFQIGRDLKCAMQQSKMKGGASKFLDEFCIWRELAFAFCFHHPRYMDLQHVLPKWAYETLQHHEKDARKYADIKRLESGSTGNELWDICQQFLIVRGELHNNLRMTWGKEVIQWVAQPDELYQTLITLNDKYALDGQSPPSYAGLLWCLGWADSPKEERRVFGKVRFRSAESIKKRYDLVKLKKYVHKDISSSSKINIARLFHQRKQYAKKREPLASPVKNKKSKIE